MTGVRWKLAGFQKDSNGSIAFSARRLAECAARRIETDTLGIRFDNSEERYGGRRRQATTQEQTAHSSEQLAIRDSLFPGLLLPTPHWFRELRLLRGVGYCYLVCSGTMITQDALTEYIRQVMPDATVSVTDRTGTMDHLIITVVSDHFKGKNLLDRHRMVYQALAVPMKDGRIHALEITTKTREEE